VTPGVAYLKTAGQQDVNGVKLYVQGGVLGGAVSQLNLGDLNPQIRPNKLGIHNLILGRCAKTNTEHTRDMVNGKRLSDRPATYPS
jgi:hypothetical protein